MDVYSIGEMLIDFLPGEEPGSYLRNAGGAPANVAIALARLGWDSALCCKVGNDDFGDFLLQTLQQNAVRVLCPNPTREAVTTMAFVTLQQDGERTFTFVRKPGADQFLHPDDVREEEIAASKIVHAGSCSLSAEPAASATEKALCLGRKMGKLVSFDVNYRGLMWDNADCAAKKVSGILPCVDLLKCSDEEVHLLGGERHIPGLMQEYRIAVVVETQGKAGARCFWNGKQFFSSGETVKAVDTTGAGDAFWSGFLAHLLENGVSGTEQLNRELLEQAVRAGHISACLCVQQKGAISSLPTKKQVEAYRLAL